MPDRTEKLTVTRNMTATTVKIALTEDGVSVNYTVKTYESGVPAAVKTARRGAERLLEAANA